MSSIPSYNAEENLRRIKMQKSTTFIVVEGVDDVPIYESCLLAMTSECKKYDVVHSGGKNAIRTFAKINKTKNAIFLIDRDFCDMEISDPRIISINRYSIENYFICEEVIGHALQFALGCKLQDAINAFSLNEYISSLEISLAKLIKVIYFYQKVVSPLLSGSDQPSWSNSFLCKNNSWQLCETKIQSLINTLLPPPFNLQAAEDFFKTNFSLGDRIEENFPGKILKHSLHRYIKNKSIEIKSKSKGRFIDVESTVVLLSSVMHRSSKLRGVLEPVANFVKAREGF